MCEKHPGDSFEIASYFIDQNLTVPLVTFKDFMMPYVVFGLTQFSKEQGLTSSSNSLRYD